MKLHNSVVLLTGASQGIGRALARHLDQQGCRPLPWCGVYSETHTLLPQVGHGCFWC
jgi:NAD(P)-dependent dehydrogenase (short-subunit alcohol dehydrogenase family)